MSAAASNAQPAIRLLEDDRHTGSNHRNGRREPINAIRRPDVTSAPKTFFSDDGLNVRLCRGSGRSLDLPAPAEKSHGAQTRAEQQQRRRKGGVAAVSVTCAV